MSPEDSPSAPDLNGLSGLLTPGRQAFVVLHKDPLRERIDVRATRVLGLEGDVLFLAQVEPPVPAELHGAEVEVAVLAGDAEKGLRPVGYLARFLEVGAGYPAAGGAQALAFAAPKPGESFETSLRMHYRVPVEEGMGVVIRLEGFVDVELLDFSAGGARARLPLGVEAPELVLGQSLPFRLLFLGSGYAAGDAIVRSLLPAEDGGSVDAGFAFTNMEIRDIRYLERMVARTVSACRQRERDADYF